MVVPIANISVGKLVVPIANRSERCWADETLPKSFSLTEDVKSNSHVVNFFRQNF